MLELDLHCKIDEDSFSRVMFAVRVLIGAVLLYFSAGCLLHYRDFLYNAARLGLPVPVPALALLAGQIVLGLLFILGWFTRWVSGMIILCCAACGVVFFAADLNKIYVVLLALLIAALLPCVCLGPGKISLDYKHAVRRAAKTFRG